MCLGQSPYFSLPRVCLLVAMKQGPSPLDFVFVLQSGDSSLEAVHLTKISGGLELCLPLVKVNQWGKENTPTTGINVNFKID